VVAHAVVSGFASDVATDMNSPEYVNGVSNE